MGCDFIHQFPVLGKHPFRFLITFLQNVHHFGIHVRCRHIAAVHAGTAAQIFIFHRGKSHQTELIAHTEPGYHVFRNIGGFFNIVGSSGGYGVKHDFFRCTSAQIAYQHIMQFRLSIQVFFFFRYLHHIPQRPHGTGNNGNLLYRLGIFLQSAQERMTDLMVGNNFTFLPAHNAVFFLLAHQYLLHRFKQVVLADIFPAPLHGIDCRLINHIGKVRAHRAAGSERYGIQIHAVVHQHVFGMNFQYFHASL